MSVSQDPTIVGGFGLAGAASVAVGPPKQQVWLDRRHPQYGAYVDHWEFLRQSYVGGPEYLSANLQPFWREGAGSFDDRQRRAHHYAFSRKVVDIFNGYLWQQPPSRKREELSPALLAFWENADGAGHDIDTVMSQQVTPWTMAFGRFFGIVDKPTTVARTRAEERTLGLFPYLTFYSPIDVLDARLENGRPVWLLLRERVRDDSVPMTSSGAVEERYRLWTRLDWTLWKVVTDEGNNQRRAVLIGQGLHPVGEVPVVTFDHRTAESWFVSPSLIWEIAYLDRSIFNHISLLDTVLYDTSFPQLRIPFQALMPGQGEDEAGAEQQARGKLIELSTKAAFTYDANSPTAPDWMAAPTEPAAVLNERIRAEIDELYRHVSLAGEMAQTVNEASGISKEHDFRKLNKLLATQADNMEQAEYQTLRYVAAWMGEDPDTVPHDAVDYPDSFDVKTLMDDLSEIAAMAQAEMPREVIAQAQKDAVKRAFGKLPETELQALLDAIDAAADAPQFDMKAAIDEVRRVDAEQRMMLGGGGRRMLPAGGGGQGDGAST